MTKHINTFTCEAALGHKKKYLEGIKVYVEPLSKGNAKAQKRSYQLG